MSACDRRWGDQAREGQVQVPRRAVTENHRKMPHGHVSRYSCNFIKLADRLHNMRTLKHLRKDKQERISRETMEIYAPLAHRLGISSVKWELEDLSFRYLNETEFYKISHMMKENVASEKSWWKRLSTKD